MVSVHRLLQVVLVVFGVTCCLVYPLAMVWPSGWAWHAGPPAASDYFMMIVGVYATLGVFLIRAARNPSAHRSLIWFAVWSSLVHAVIMALQALADPAHMGHMMGDVPVLFIGAIVLGGLAYADRHAAPLRTVSA
jgi:hypothetical protein